MTLKTFRWTLSRLGTPAISVLWGAALTKADQPGLIAFTSVCYVIYIWLVEWMVRPEQYDKNVLEAFLEGFLEVMEVSPLSDVRCALYIPIAGEKLKMVAGYVPKRHGSSLTELDNSKGIVGRAFRTQSPLYFIVQQGTSDNTYRDMLVKDWGFTMQEARNINKERRAFLAIPVVSDSVKIRAIVYADAVDPGILIGANPTQTVDKAERAAMLLEPLLRTMEGKL